MHNLSIFRKYGRIGTLLRDLFSQNDMCSCTSPSCTIVMYADDTIIIVSDRDLNVVSNNLSVELSRCFHWLTNNLLSMHMGKTETIVFTSKRKKHLTTNFSVSCNGKELLSKSEVKYLGLKLDQSLSGESIVNSIVSKCSSILKFLYRHSRVLNQNSRKLLASALIQSHFDFGVSAWYLSTTKVLQRKLQVAQNKMVRFILNLESRAHIGQSELNRINYLNTSDRAQQFMLNHMYNVYNKSAPSYLSQRFNTVQSQHQYFTRNSDHNFVVSRFQGVSRYNFSVQGVKVWNDLPTSIKCITSKSSFKQKVKHHLRTSTQSREEAQFVFY